MAKKVPEKVKQIREWKVQREAGSKSISFSQLSTYRNCPLCWSRAYVLGEAPYSPSIHTTFGSAVHETLQTWLDRMYNESVKASEELDLHELLKENLRRIYLKEQAAYGKPFSTAEELASFYDDGVAIVDYVKKYRKAYFNPSKGEWLVGCEIPLLYKLQDKFWYKGFIDILTYDEPNDTWKIWDIKTSTGSWSAETKADKVKTDQILLYKHFLSQEFNIDPSKIEVEYFIVKRKLPENPEFPAQTKRVQEFTPSHGPRSIKRAVTEVENFCKDVLVEGQGRYREGEFKATPSTKACRWCIFRDNCKFHI